MSKNTIVKPKRANPKDNLQTWELVTAGRRWKDEQLERTNQVTCDVLEPGGDTS
jgi:hypothetical protein